MIFINPQWQGSGLTDELKFGAETLNLYFKDIEKAVIPLSTKVLATIHNIKCFEPLLEQTKHFKEIIADSKLNKISTVGGDCGIELIPISYLNNIYQEDLCILWIDAHADLNTPESSPSKTFHGMPLRTLLGEGNEQFKNELFSFIKPEQVCYIGLRDIDLPERDYILAHNMTILDDCQYPAIRNKIGNFKNIYIHLDLDVLDVSEFQFSLFPSTNGLFIADVEELIKTVKANHNVVGFCITESTARTLGQLEAIIPILEQVEL